MAVLLVTYDLNRPGQNYPDLLNTIRTYAWAKLSESSYAIVTNESPEDLFNKLQPLIDTGDRLFIITLKKPWHGWGMTETYDWLNQHLPW